MVLSFRFLWALITASFGSKRPVYGPLSRTFTVLPFLDCETGISMSAARYSVLCEIVQNECNLRSGVIRAALKHGWWAAILSNTIYYKKSVRSFSRLKITVELVAWDEKFAIWRNLFCNSKGDICAISFTKVCIRSKKGIVPLTEFFKVVSPGTEPRGFTKDLSDCFTHLEKLAQSNLPKGS